MSDRESVSVFKCQMETATQTEPRDSEISREGSTGVGAETDRHSEAETPPTALETHGEAAEQVNEETEARRRHRDAETAATPRQANGDRQKKDTEGLFAEAKTDAR